MGQGSCSFRVHLTWTDFYSLSTSRSSHVPLGVNWGHYGGQCKAVPPRIPLILMQTLFSYVYKDATYFILLLHRKASNSFQTPTWDGMYLAHPAMQLPFQFCNAWAQILCISLIRWTNILRLDRISCMQGLKINLPFILSFIHIITKKEVGILQSLLVTILLYRVCQVFSQWSFIHTITRNRLALWNLLVTVYIEGISDVCFSVFLVHL